MRCHSNHNIDQRSGDLESCSSAPGSLVLPIAMTGHSKNIVVALLAMLFLPLMLPSMATTHRSPSRLSSLEAFLVLRKVPSKPGPITSDPSPPPATNVRMYLQAFPVLRTVPSGPNPMTSDPPPPPATNVGNYLEAFPVLRKVPSGPDPITSDPLLPPATNVRTFDLAIVREVLPVNQVH
jgi:hypothetical protein